MGLVSFFRRVLPPPVHARPQPSTMRTELTEAVKFAVLGILDQNFAMMGIEMGRLPMGDGPVALRSRGYLLGLADAVLQQFAPLHPTEDEFIYSMATAFVATYGTADSTIGLHTIGLLQAGEQCTLEGVGLAHADVDEVYSGKPWAAPAGLWLINNGDGEGLAYNLALLDLSDRRRFGVFAPRVG